MKRAGYRELHSHPIPKGPGFVDHFVVGPTGVYLIVAELWDKRLPIRTRDARQLWHGPFSKRDQLERARRAAEQASDQLTCELGSKVYVRPALAIYGPKVPWHGATIREVDVFDGGRLREYLRQNAGMKDRPKLSTTEIERIYGAAAPVLSLSSGSDHEQVAERLEETMPLEDNPIHSDILLFEMYMKALDAVVAEPEIGAAFSEFGLSAASLRMEMVRNARRVLESAPREFAAYQNAMASESSVTADPSRISHGSSIELIGILNPLWKWMAIVGALIMVSGVIVSAVWRWPVWLVWPGAAMFADAALLRLSVWLVPRLLKGTLNAEGSPKLAAARKRLMTAVSKSELLAQVRTFINTERQSRFGLRYAVVSSPGLSDVYNSTNRVPTRVAAELDGLIGRVGGASIGVAGPRGSGKSTLLREYCEEDTSPTRDYQKSDSARRAWGDLRCVIAAPVDYVARDFVLHLFATFCRAVIGRYGRKTGSITGVTQRAILRRQDRQLASILLWRAIFYGASATALLYWENTIARWLAVPSAWVWYAAVAVICLAILDAVRVCAPRITRRPRRASRGDGKALAAEARKHLSRIRYLQTYTSEWSGALSLARGSAKGEHKRGVSRAEQPLNYPEIVDNFRDFASKVAKEVHSTGNRVFIGVDELDKIGSAEQAERFLNEIKGVFGVSNLYFMVSMSNDALTAFERRGLPLRDAFDSSFDEIIEVGPLDYVESRRLLYRRVIGLTEPYVALCHCLAGGLPRELIRFAREVVCTAAILDPSSITEPATVTDEDFALSPHVVIAPDKSGDHNHSPTLGTISVIVVQSELHHKLHAVQHVLRSATGRDATDLLDILHGIPRYLGPARPILDIVDVMMSLVIKNHQRSPGCGLISPPMPTIAPRCKKCSQMGWIANV